ALERVTIEDTASGDTVDVECDALILQLGFVSHLGPIESWGLEGVGKKQVRVDPTSFETALPNVFAAGDVAYYEGKITLITIGLGEAAIAANQCVGAPRGGNRRQSVRGARARRQAAARVLHRVARGPKLAGLPATSCRSGASCRGASPCLPPP